ncbi:MAG TPA: PIN domain-containing protein [Thermodesulfovibrionales bacterium]|nr:PIN domain-containing protein [Thermodesulfovibrionales bacterium]
MKRVFVDTSALVALFDRKDRNHLRAKALLEKIRTDRTHMIITDCILAECVTIVLSAAGHHAAVAVGELILGSKIIQITWLDESTKRRAWDFFKKRSDKTFSFTDCTSFAVMKELGMAKYFSFNSDFKKAGFMEYGTGIKGRQ